MPFNLNEYLDHNAPLEPSGARLMPNGRMQLVDREMVESLPELYSQDGKAREAMARAKLFTPTGSWTWFAAEGSYVDANGEMTDDASRAVDVLFFGLVDGFEQELGYFSLSELASVSMPKPFQLLGIERDLWFDPKPLSQCAAG